MADTLMDQSVSTTGPGAPDPLARAAVEPDIAALQKEYALAWSQDPDIDTRLVTVENIRYNRWPGQSIDGLKHADEFEKMDREARPYDGAPDTRIFHADDIINSLVDVFYTAFWAAEIKVNPATARAPDMEEAAELRTVINWMKFGPLLESLVDDVERAAQIMAMVGWAVLHPDWRTQLQIKMQKITMDQVMQTAQKAAKNPGSALFKVLATAPALIGDPEMAPAAVELLQMIYPDLETKEARRVVRELRENQQAEFPMTEENSLGPALDVLCPWYHFVMPIEATANPKYGRLGFVRVLLPEWALDERAAAEHWDNEDFVAAVKATKGRTNPSETTVEDELDLNQNLCELIYAFNWATNEDGAPGIFCTVFSSNISAAGDPGKQNPAKAYGKHWMLNLGHKHSPFIHLLMEVTGWRPNDSRGVCDVVATNQAEIKQQRDATFIFSQLSNTPPIIKQGTQASKLPPEFGPLAIINATGGNPWSRLDLTSGGHPDIALKLYELVKKESEDYYGLERSDTPPQRSARRLQRYVQRWLAKWGEAFWQLAALAYQNLDPADLEQIIGRKPRLTADKISRYCILLKYDVRAGDGEWIERLVNWVVKLMETGGATGMNLEKLLNLILRYIDPGLYEEVADDPPGNKAKVFRETRDEVNNIMLGNQPQAGVDLTEKNPTARMKMTYAQQIVQSNPRFKGITTPGGPDYSEPHAKNFKTYMDNLQHSYQETVLSKMQGRLGVKNVAGPQ